ncbi:MAG: prephenate dehydrogenase/arogenate dehydrogenase family protein [Oscillospiraceae bacterium]|nr:prephenate dehydrogenase/arogenate dehydrogenase family protein [Oscillospiraceae bacterium]
MNIAIVGLGLIGGSFAKTIKAKTTHNVYGLDTDPDVQNFARSCGYITAITAQELKKADITLVCLNPDAAVDFVMQNINCFSPGSVVLDICGVKEPVVRKLSAPLAEKNIVFLGTHPMAGREYSGFEYSLPDLFDGASWILTPEPSTSPNAVRLVRMLGEQLGFDVVISDAKRHDELIAYTSQLAHITSNAYIKSPAVANHKGFSAGSFLDLTRIARVNEDMWTSLMMLNRENLSAELGILIGNLTEYKNALDQNDGQKLKELLKSGSDIKKSIK